MESQDQILYQRGKCYRKHIIETIDKVKWCTSYHIASMSNSVEWITALWWETTHCI